MSQKWGPTGLNPKSWAVLGLCRAAGEMPRIWDDPVGHWDAQASTADWRTAINIARGVPLDQISRQGLSSWKPAQA